MVSGNNLRDSGHARSRGNIFKYSLFWLERAFTLLYYCEIALVPSYITSETEYRNSVPGIPHIVHIFSFIRMKVWFVDIFKYRSISQCIAIFYKV